MNFGCGLLNRRGERAWKRRSGPRVLTVKCSSSEEAEVSKKGVKEFAMPALAMITSMFMMAWPARLARRAWVEDSSPRVRWVMWRMLVEYLGALIRAFTSIFSCRTVAITVVLRRKRSYWTMPRPIPALVNNDSQAREIGVIGAVPLFAPVINCTIF